MVGCGWARGVRCAGHAAEIEAGLCAHAGGVWWGAVGCVSASYGGEGLGGCGGVRLARCRWAREHELRGAYAQMLRACERGHQAWGIGRGPSAVCNAASARVPAAAAAQDGRIFVTSRGKQRFAIKSVVKEKPVLMCEWHSLSAHEHVHARVLMCEWRARVWPSAGRATGNGSHCTAMRAP